MVTDLIITNFAFVPLSDEANSDDGVEENFGMNDDDEDEDEEELGGSHEKSSDDDDDNGEADAM